MKSKLSKANILRVRSARTQEKIRGFGKGTQIVWELDVARDNPDAEYKYRGTTQLLEEPSNGEKILLKYISITLRKILLFKKYL